MEYLIILLGLVIALTLGYIVGLVQNGINVTINHNHPEKELPTTDDGKPVYNDVYIEEMDPAIRNYLDKNNGQLKI